MKQTQFLTQFVILMILFVGIMSTSLALENNLSAEKGKKKAKKSAAKANVTIQALAHLACGGKAKCMAKKIKTQKCKLGKFSLAPALKALKAYKAAAGKKNIKGQVKASSAFKKAMSPIIKCALTPKKYSTAFKRGFKIHKGKKAKKAAKKAKKAAKKTKKAKKAVKKAKKGKKAKKVAAYQKTVMALQALYKLC
jgi:cellobiose-specific phosphotransferase system component IIC